MTRNANLATVQFGPGPGPEVTVWNRCSHHALASLAVNSSCLESRTTGAGGNAESVISALTGIMGREPRVDLACQVRRSGDLLICRFLAGPTRSYFHTVQQLTGRRFGRLISALGRCRTFSWVHNRISVALVFLMHRLQCSLNVGWDSILAPSHHLASLLNRTKPFPTLIVAVRFDWKWFSWPPLRVKRATSVFTVSNWRSLLLAHSMLSAAQASRPLTPCVTFFLVATHPRSATKERLSPVALSSPQFVCPAVCFVKNIGNMSDRCCTPASTKSLWMKLPSITISNIVSERKLSVHRMMSLSIPLVFIVWISHPLATHGNASLISIRITPAMLSSFHAECALSTMMAAALMADLFFLLPHWPSLSCAHFSTLSDSSSATTFLTTFPMHLCKEIERYNVRFI